MFYDRYIEQCQKIGKKPYTVAKELCLTNSNVAQWKKGSTPRKEVLQRIAEYFQVSVVYFLTGEEQKEKPPAQGGELSEKDVRLIEWFRSLPPEKQKAILISQDAPKELID